MAHGKSVAFRQVWRVRAGPAVEEQDLLSVEEPLEIRVCSEPVAVTMRTPGQDEKLAVGFLFSEGHFRSLDEVGSVAHCGRLGEEGQGNVLEVTPAPGARFELERLVASRREGLTSSSCGVCGRRSIEDLIALCGEVPPGPRVGAPLVMRSAELLAGAQRDFPRTGGVHGAAALDCRGEVLAAHEDIGRHNAVDKVVGELLYGRRLGGGAEGPSILVVSGRASFEMVQKAAVAKIPLLVAVSAASTLAVDLAERVGITLVAFSRAGGFNVYAHPERIDAGLRLHADR